MRDFCLALLSVLLAGCLTAAQRQVVAIAQVAKAQNEKTMACLQKITTNPAYEPLAKHAPLDSRINPTLTQLSDRSVTTDDEIQLINIIHNEIASCREQAIEGLMPVLPGIIPIIVRGYHEGDLITVDLMERKITWGEYNKQKVRLRDETMEKARLALMQLERDFQASHNAEVLQRQVAFATLSNWAIQQQALVQRQQAINALTRPLVTSCSSFRYTVRCVSR